MLESVYERAFQKSLCTKETGAYTGGADLQKVHELHKTAVFGQKSWKANIYIFI